MHSEVTLVLLWATMVIVYSQEIPTIAKQMPTIPKEPCLYADCGAIDVTPQPIENTISSQKYRILSKFGSRIYIGGLREIIQIDPTCPGGSEPDPWMKRSDPIPSCVRDSSVGLKCNQLIGNTNPTLICDNYIRVAEEVDEDKLLVCGTSSAFPRCYSFENNCGLTSDGTNLDGGNCADEESYEAHEPYRMAARNWDQNTTLGYIGSDLFIGSSPDISVTNSFVGKLQMTGIMGNFSSGNPYQPLLDTSTVEARSVNEANFVGRPFKYSNGSDYVLFFFRETAVEHINHGKIVYSRVARVCENDMGNNGEWSSYIKARLNCSRPGQYPEYLDEIQDVFPTNINGKIYFYAVFTHPPNAPPQSAVCIYTLDDIHNVFQTSQFKSARTSNSLWLPVSKMDVPAPRPGHDCSMPNTDTAFLQNNPLMNDLVENFNYKRGHQINDSSDYPLFVSNGARFTKITVDSRDGNDFSDAVIFVGTDSGEVWKVTDLAGDDVKIVKIFSSANGNAITGLEFLQNGDKSYVYATTHDQIIKIDLMHGAAQTRLQHNEIYPPYLEPVKEGEVFDASNVLKSHKVDLTVCDNREVLLLCEGILDPTLKPANAIWRFQPDGNDTMVPLEDTHLGHLIEWDTPRPNVSNPFSFIKIKTHSRTSGAYQCVITNDEGDIESETSLVTVECCITEQAVINRQVLFDELEMQAMELSAKFENEKICDVNPVTCDEACHWNFPED